MNDRISMRLCCGDDIDALKRLWSMCFTDDSQEDIEAFFSRVFPLSVAFAGFDNDEAVVMLYLLPAVACDNDSSVPVWYLYAGGTHPSYRSQGLYRSLMATAREWSTLSDRHAIYLHPANEGLYKLYATLGYDRPIMSMEPFGASETHLLPLDTYLEERRQANSDNIIIWEPEEAIAKAFIKPTWIASASKKSVLQLIDGQNVIEQLPLSLTDVSLVTTSLWTPTTDDTAILEHLESALGYSLIYGD